MKHSTLGQNILIRYSAMIIFLASMLISSTTFGENNQYTVPSENDEYNKCIECIQYSDHDEYSEFEQYSEFEHYSEFGQYSEFEQNSEFTEYYEETVPVNAKYMPAVYSGAAITMGAYSSISGNTQSVAATTLGEAAEVRGSILAGAAVTVEKAAVVTGNLNAGEAATLGATALVIGNLIAEDSVFIGAQSEISGDLTSGKDAKLGALAKVGGNATAATVLTLGAYAQVGKDELEGHVRAVSGPIVLGQNASVKGDAKAGTIISFGMNAIVGGDQKEFVDPQGFIDEFKSEVATRKDELTQKQRTLADRVSQTYNELDTTIALSRNFDSGVYHASALSTTAGITLTFKGALSDEPEEWLINVDTYISFGANLIIELDENVAPGSTITFNSGSYTTIGANSILIGTIFAGTYITTGENTTISGVLEDCGGMFATNGAITMGAHSKFGLLGCKQSVQQGEGPDEGGNGQGPADGGYVPYVG